MIVLAVGLAAQPATATGPEPASAAVNRYGGSDRYETAIKVSEAQWQAGTASAVVLARGDDFPDALAGGPLAAHVDGPLLLSPSQSLRGDIRNEILRVAPQGSTVYVLGGTGALSPGVVEELELLGYVVERVAGANRYETAVAIARLLPPSDQVMLATGHDFPDAVVASVPAAAGQGTGGTPYPVLLTNGKKMSAATLAYIHELVGESDQWLTLSAVGGWAAEALAESLDADDDLAERIRWRRLQGTDRYETAAMVADWFYPLPGSYGVGLATGLNFPDALTAATHLADKLGPILLTPPYSLAPSTANYLNRYAFYGPVEVYGGEAAISDDVVAQAGTLVLPSSEQASHIGDVTILDLQQGESVAVSFHAEAGTDLLVEVDGSAATTLFSPLLEQIGYTSQGSRWYDSIPRTGVYRLVVVPLGLDDEVSVALSSPTELLELEIVPNGDPVDILFEQGQDAAIRYEGNVDVPLALRIKQPVTMCAILHVRDAGGSLLVSQLPCGDVDVAYMVQPFVIGTVTINYMPLETSYGTVLFQLTSL